MRGRLKDDYHFGMSDYKIHSYSTFDNYVSEYQLFGKWLIETKQLSKHEKIEGCEKYTEEYLQEKLNEGSIYSVKKARSALGMLYGHTIKLDNPIPERNPQSVTRSRRTRENDKHFSPTSNKARKPSINKQLEAGTLKQENERLQRFIDNIPLDMMQEIQSQQRRTPQKGRYERD